MNAEQDEEEHIRVCNSDMADERKKDFVMTQNDDHDDVLLMKKEYQNYQLQDYKHWQQYVHCLLLCREREAGEEQSQEEEAEKAVDLVEEEKRIYIYTGKC